MSRPWFIFLSFPLSYMNKLELTRTMLTELGYMDRVNISLLSTLAIQTDRQLELNEMTLPSIFANICILFGDDDPGSFLLTICQLCFQFVVFGDDVPIGQQGHCPGLGSPGLALGGATFRDAQLGEESV